MSAPTDFRPSFPRVLLVSHHPFETRTATGITLTNMFRGWPKTEISQLYGSNEDPEREACETFHRLPPTSAPFDYALRRLLTRSGRPIVQGRSVGAAIPADTKQLTGQQRLHSDMRAAADISPVRLDVGTRSWLRSIAPDVVYTPLGNLRVARVAAQVAEFLHCPVVPHFLDDWPTTLYSSGELGGRARTFVDRAIGRVLRRAPVGLAIGPDMAKEFEQRYRIPFVDVMNCVDFEDGSIGDRWIAPVADQTKLQFVYSGGLHLGRDAALREIAEALPVARKAGCDVALTIIGPASEGFNLSRAAGADVEFVGPLRSDQVMERLSAADILVHVESMEPQFRAFTRLSISTKIPQYLASGRPILAYGPAELASMRYLQASGAAAAVTSVDPHALADTVIALARDSARRTAMGRAGRDFAHARHRSDVVLERLRTALQQASSSRPGSLGPPSQGEI